MGERIRCTNTECISRTTEPESACFNVTIVVGEFREGENINRLDPVYFECIHCGDKAEAVPECQEEAKNDHPE